MTLKVGFIGMGIMGIPMSLNILNAGYDVMVYNRTRDKTSELEIAGAKTASSLAEIARWSDIIILMLTGPEAVNAVVSGPDGLLQAAPEGKTLINMSTVSPAYTRWLSRRLDKYSVTLIDAPVSGSKKPAQDGTLIILAGGPEEKINELEPLFLAMGKKVVYCGDAGQGSSMKMAVNLLLGTMMEGLCEAVNFGQRCGLSVETILDTILSGPLSNGLFGLKTEMLKTDTFPPQFPLKHMLKDLRFVLQTADENGAALPVGHSIFQLYRQGQGLNLSDADFCAVKQVLTRMNDVSE